MDTGSARISSGGDETTDGAAPSSGPATPGMSSAARERVISRLVHAAARLYAASGPDRVSLRDVAAAADVNYGLIHQYVGTKQDLQRLVYRKISEDAAATFTDAEAVPDAVDALLQPSLSSPYVRMLAWSLLQGERPTALLGPAPGVAALARRLAAHQDARGSSQSGAPLLADDPRVQVAFLACVALGWGLFGPFLEASAGLGADDDVAAEDAVAQAVFGIAKRCLDIDARHS